MTDSSGSGRPAIDGQRLWAGGAATALVAALIAVAGVIISRGLFDIAVLAPEGEGLWGDATTWWYAAVAGLSALLATGLAHLLLMTTPQPLQFFGWVIGLLTLIGVVAPFTSDSSLAAESATGLINLVLGIAIGSLVSSIANTSRRQDRRPRDQGSF